MIRNSKSTAAGEPRIDPAELSDTIGNDAKLRDTLLRIFIFYCSYGDHLNTDVMTQAKFSKFVRDIDIVAPPSLRESDVDLIFQVRLCIVVLSTVDFAADSAVLH